LSRIGILRQNINIILHLLPEIVRKYPKEDQELIIDFLDVIRYFEEVDYNRDLLIERFSECSHKARSNNRYLDTPFLGFTVIIAENALYNLSIARFQSQEFYSSLLQQLRLLFHLLKVKEPLVSIKFEEALQKIKMLHSPLTFDEFRLLNQTYSILKSGGIKILNSNYIRKEISNNEPLLRRSTTKKEITRLFKLVEGRWWIHFHSPAFGLSRVVFEFKRKKSVPLTEIIDLNDQKNTTLCNSDFFKPCGSDTEYIGIFLVPNKDLNLLNIYFQQCEEKGMIISKELTTIHSRRRSTSLKYYKDGTGWNSQPRSKEKLLEKLIRSSDPNERMREEILLNYTPPESPSWYYSDQPNAKQIIELYCRSPTEFSYMNLPFNIQTESNPGKFSWNDIELLNRFYEEKVINIGFIPWRIIDDYSTNMYFVKASNLPLSKIEQFLNVIPYAEVYFSSKDLFLWTVLKPKKVKWIKNSLRFTIIPIKRIHVIKDLDFQWFDMKTLQWFTPKLLQSNGKDG